jgi:hypothetical protein
MSRSIMAAWATAALLLPVLAARAAPAENLSRSSNQYRAGDIFEISRDVESSEKSSGGLGGTSSSTDRDTVMERVVAASPTGIELEYDLPRGATADDRTRQWQFPVRVLRSPGGPIQLLNRPELAARAAAWLRAAGLTEAACGHWYFTWNAFKVECDPQSVVGIIEGFDLGPDDLRDGAVYRDPDAQTPATVKMIARSPNGATFHVEMAIDPNKVRQGQAQADVVTGEVLRRPVTFEVALQARSSEKISGAIKITLDADTDGRVRRLTKVTTLNVTNADGQLTTRTVTETLERRLISGPHA